MDWLPKTWPAVVVSPHSGKTSLDTDVCPKRAGLSLLLGTQWVGLWLSYAGTGPTVLAMSPALSFSVMVSIVILFLHPSLYEHPPALWMHAQIQTHCLCVTFALVWLCQDCQVILHMDLNFVFSLTNFLCHDSTLCLFTHLVRELLPCTS